MGSSLLFNRKLRIVLAGVVSLEVSPTTSYSDIPRPFPVLGEVSVSESHWNGAPALFDKLAENVQEEALRFQITSSAAEQNFSINLLEESRRGFQKLLKARKPSPSLFVQQMSNLRLAEISLLEGKADDAIRLTNPYLKDGNPYIAQEAQFLLARCLLVKKDWQGVNNTIKELVRVDPAYSNDLAINLLRGVACLEQDRPDEALVYVKRYPDEPSALYYQAVAHIKKHEMSAALPLYQQILVKSPHSEWVDRMRMVLGEAFYMA